VTSWNPNANGTVFSLALSGNSLYVGGGFSNIGGQTRNRIAALDTGTGNATLWNPNSGGNIWSIAISGTTVYVGGEYLSNIGGQIRTNIAALNASTGNALSWNPIPNGRVFAIEVSGNNLYVGGEFTRIGGVFRNYLASINPSTGLATSWNPNSGGTVNIISYFGNTLYVGGGFSNMNIRERNGLAVFTDNPFLPVNWQNFKATRIKNKAYLKWSTATETDNERFDVERSTDNSNFSFTGTVKGAGTSLVSQHYSFEEDIEEHHLGVSHLYYRLKQIDFNGKYDYSKTEVIELDKELIGYSVYPNPTSGSILLSGATGTLVQMLNIHGEPLHECVLNESNRLFDMRQFSRKGLYFIRFIDTSGKAEVKKVMVQ